MSCSAIPPVLASVVAHIAAAVPARATFLDLLLGAAATKGGHVTDAILAAGLSRGWSTYYWFLEQGRWSWLRICEAQLDPGFTVRISNSLESLYNMALCVLCSAKIIPSCGS
jgi:hypothetical protein